MFEIPVNGTPRTYRDLEKLAIDASRMLRARHKFTEIAVIDMKTGKWLSIPISSRL